MSSSSTSVSARPEWRIRCSGRRQLTRRRCLGVNVSGSHDEVGQGFHYKHKCCSLSVFQHNVPPTGRLTNHVLVCTLTIGDLGPNYLNKFANIQINADMAKTLLSYDILYIPMLEGFVRFSKLKYFVTNSFGDVPLGGGRQ